MDQMLPSVRPLADGRRSAIIVFEGIAKRVSLGTAFLPCCRRKEPRLSPPRLAFIGPSHAISPWLFQGLRRHGTLEAVCDNNTACDASRIQARWTFTDAATLLSEAEPSGVVLACPHGARHRLIKQCLSAGASVLLTGVPCSAAVASRLALFSKLSGRFVMAAPPIQYSPAALLARRLLDSGKFGTPISLTLRSTRRGTPRDDFDDHGPVPTDQVFEAVSLVQLLLGPLRQVMAVSQDEGVLMAAGITNEGVPVSLALHASGPAEMLGVDVEMRSADGSVLLWDRDGGLSCSNGSRVDACHRPSLASSDPAVELGFDGLVGEFVRFLRPGGGGLVGPMLHVLASTEAVLASVARGRPVVPRLPQPGQKAAEVPKTEIPA